MDSSRTLVHHVRAILAAWDPSATLMRITAPDSGYSGTVHFLATTRGDLVLHIPAEDADAWKLEKERTLYRVMRSLDIPVPEVLRVDTSRSMVPFPYSLATRIAGEPYSRVFHSLGDEENARLYGTLGEYLGRLHTTTFSRFGDIAAGHNGLEIGPARELASGAPGQASGPFGTWPAMHDEIVRARLWLMHGTAFEDLIAPIHAWFESHRYLLPERVVPRLLHMDLHRGNVLIADGAVVGIVDVEEAIIGHNEYDLMRTELANFRNENPIFAEAFMDAYANHVRLDEGYERRRTFYDLSRTLVWIRSLILYGERYVGGVTSHSCQAARDHVLSLISRD